MKIMFVFSRILNNNVTYLQPNDGQWPAPAQSLTCESRCINRKICHSIVNVHMRKTLKYMVIRLKIINEKKYSQLSI